MKRLISEACKHRDALEAFQRRVDAGETFTGEEYRKLDDHIRGAYAAGAGIRQEQTDEQVRKWMKDFGAQVGMPGPSGPVSGDARVKAVRTGGWGADLVRQQSGPFGFKALTPSGQLNVSVPVDPEPVRQGEPVHALRQLIPAVQDSAGAWSYFRQSQRVNRAAPVAPGAVKPTSDYELTRIDGRSVTVAHLSQPVPRQDLADATMLQQFIEAEMSLGLEDALEAQILHGDGTGENFEGLDSVSGTQAQAWTGDILGTVRAGITKLQILGLAPTGLVLHPTDWEAAEMAAAEQFAANPGTRAPVEQAARTLWSVPVALSTAATPGVGWLADFAGSTRLYVRQEATLDWSEGVYDPDALGAGQGASDWSRNLVRFRAEMRAGFAVLRAPGAVRLDLTA